MKDSVVSNVIAVTRSGAFKLVNTRLDGCFQAKSLENDRGY